MRARGIQPGFYKNDQLAECSIYARYIFPGLWMLADRMGRLEYRPKKIKGELLPFDNADVPALLDELETNGLIKIYEADGKKYIWIPAFLCHQRPHCKEKASVIPRHPDDPNYEQDSTQEQPDPHLGRGQTSPRSGSDLTQEQPDPHLGASRHALIPDSLIPDLRINSTQRSSCDSTTAPDPKGGFDERNFSKADEMPGMEFLELRSMYDELGRPEGPQAGFIEYKALKKSRLWPGIGHLREDITWRSENMWEKGYAPSLKRYLAEHGWEAPRIPRQQKDNSHRPSCN